MSTLDQKAPPAAETPGTGELLDALVADHLQRAAGPQAPAEAVIAQPPPPLPTSPAATNNPDMLQREIEALLAGTKPVNVASPSVEPPKAAMPDLDQAIAAELTKAELDVLVPPALSLDAAVVENTETSAAGMADEETETKLTEAEGVLAEELAQLMAETTAAETKTESPTAEPQAAKTRAAEIRTGGTPEVETQAIETPVAVAPAHAPIAEPATIPPAAPSPPAAESVAPPVETPAAPAPAVAGPESLTSDPEPATPATPPVAAAEAQAAPSATPEARAAQVPPGVPEHPVVILAPDEEEEEETEKPEGRIGRMFSDLGLMVAQIIDVPFSWIDAMDKNLLGLAALMLLVSGVVLIGLSWWMGR